MKIPKVDQNQSGKVPGGPGHQKQWFEWVPAWKVDQIWEHKKERTISIEIDPGASQERRKQCTFEVQFVLFPSVFVVLS